MDSPIWTPLHLAALPPDAMLDVMVRRSAVVTPALLEERLRRGLAEYTRQLRADQRDLRLKVSTVEGTPIGHQVAFILYFAALNAIVFRMSICRGSSVFPAGTLLACRM